MTSAIGPASVLRLRPLTIVAQGSDFLVGDSERNTYVVLPPIGVQVIELLRSGQPIGEVTAVAAEKNGADVDVTDFAASLCDLGFAELAPDPTPELGVQQAAGLCDVGACSGAATELAAAPASGPARRRWAPLVVGAPAWALSGLAALVCCAAFALRPSLWPSSKDAFMLASPVRSMVALITLTYPLRAVHEMCHWLAARAEGVAARVRIGRRLYMLVFETDLTGMWGLPRRRRYWPLLIGLGFDTVVLAIVLAARLAAAASWWQPALGLAKLLAAMTFLQVAGIAAQFFLFLRTDIYAVLATAAGCFNLWSVTRLTLRRHLGLARPPQRAELAAAHPRDQAVARWYVWLYAAGMLLAGWVFVGYFVPATLRLVRWIASTLLAANPGSAEFWEVIGFGLITLSPQLLTLWVAGHDWLHRMRASATGAGNS